MSETARAADRRRVNGVARWARDGPGPSRAHLLVDVELTIPSYPGTLRDAQGSHALKVAAVERGAVLHGATLRHAAAPFHAASLVVSETVVRVVGTDVTARVLEEGFL